MYIYLLTILPLSFYYYISVHVLYLNYFKAAATKRYFLLRTAHKKFSPKDQHYFYFQPNYKDYFFQ